MKTYLLISALLISYAVSAQLTITPGGELHLTGNAQLTLNNADLVNNGLFSTGNSTVFFTGGISSFISGTQPVQFYFIEINKISASVRLNRNISITGQAGFTTGFLDLNGFDFDLGATATLIGEQGASRITGNNGGVVLSTAILNAPTLVNPANLGAFITSTQSLGTVTIRRGHQSQANGYGNGNSILRYYEITPANNTGLDATLRFSYFDEELNGLAESGLILYKRDNAVSWSGQGFDTRNTSINYVEKTGIASFSRVTLSSPNNALPVLFSLFNVKCEGDKIIVNWKTAQEQQSSHFNVERSIDGIHWTTIGTVPAAGNSSSERSYVFTDNNPAQTNYYRIVEHDINGQLVYSGVLRAACSISSTVFSLWPNPLQDVVLINIVTNSASKCKLQVYDSKGALLKVQYENVLAGSNQVRMDMRKLPNGVYILSAEWDNGQTKKTVRVVKH